MSWIFTENGSATNGTDKAIVIQVELVARFDVFLHEKTDAGIKTTPLAFYMTKDEAKEYVRSLVDEYKRKENAK